MIRRRRIPVRCAHCGRGRLGPIWMVRDDLWDRYGVGAGELHLRCLVSRLGRRLTLDDLTDAPCNDAIREILAAVEVTS